MVRVKIIVRSMLRIGSRSRIKVGIKLPLGDMNKVRSILISFARVPDTSYGHDYYRFRYSLWFGEDMGLGIPQLSLHPHRQQHHLQRSAQGADKR